MSSAPLNLGEFRRWLEAKPRRRFKSNNCRSCPLARFLQEKRGPKSRMYVKRYYTQAKGSWRTSEHASPVWAVSFVNAIDASLYEKSVNAREALKTLLETAYRKA